MEHVTGEDAAGTGFSFFVPNLEPPYLGAYPWCDYAVGVGVDFESNRMTPRFLYSRTHENNQMLVCYRLTVSESDQHEPFAGLWCLLILPVERADRSKRG